MPDSNNVVDLKTARLERAPHNAGVALCGSCGHKWAAVVPAGEAFIECPLCHTMKGRFVHPTLIHDGLPRMQCTCGCQMFMFTGSELVCINCAEHHSSG